MAIKIEIKPTTYKATIGDYGTFEISPLGAGAEAELRIALRECEEATKATEEFNGLIEREKNGEKLDKDSEEYKACMEALKVAGEKLEYAEQLSFDKLKYLDQYLRSNRPYIPSCANFASFDKLYLTHYKCRELILSISLEGYIDTK